MADPDDDLTIPPFLRRAPVVPPAPEKPQERDESQEDDMAKGNRKTKGEEDASANIARETLTGDLRDFLLDRLKHDKNPLPWNMLPEDQQRAMIQQATDAARAAVDRAVRIIAADGRAVMVGSLVKAQIKDGIQAQINMSKSDPLRHALIDSQGMDVLVVVVDSEAYTGERKAAVPEPNQRQMFNEPDGDGAPIQ